MGAAERLPDIYTFEDLQQICKPGESPRLATVERWARQCGIRYKYDGRGGIWTTAEALSAALGLRQDRVDDAPKMEDLI